MKKKKYNLSSEEQNLAEKFPAELLNRSSKERFDYFQQYTVAHPILEDIYNGVWRALHDADCGSIILVFGPAGVGKTTLLSYLEKKIKEGFLEKMKEDKELIPLVRIEAKSPHIGNFDWGDYFRELLIGLAEPGVDQKIDLSKWQNPWQHYIETAGNSRFSSGKLRKAGEVAIKHRRPFSILIDEGQHITVVSSGRKLLDQQNTIKSIANITKTTHVLFGTYDLMMLRDLNGQLARRQIDLHFRRYKHTSPQDINDFKNILWQMQNHIPIADTPDLLTNWEFFYERCLGCIGVLKEWLNRAFSMVLSNGLERFEMKYFEATALSGTKALKLYEEILDGEGSINEDKDKERRLKKN